MKAVLQLAGVYNILFGVWAVGWPMAWFEMSGMKVPEYPFLWQCIGMIVGVYGVGYLIASTAPLRHWPIILVGFLGKVFGPVGFLWMASQGEIPWAAGWINITNDLIWLVPFAMILWAAGCLMVGRPAVGEPTSFEEAIEKYGVNSGETLGEASEEKPVAVVFLRHFGCTFTRQLLKNLQEMERSAEEHGARLVLVHMLQEGEEIEFIGNSKVSRIADPWCELYQAFGLGKGGFLELFGPRVWVRGFIAIFRGCGVGHLAGDGLQMPGAFLVKDRKIVVSRKAESAADLPEVEGLFEEGR